MDKWLIVITTDRWDQILDWMERNRIIHWLPVKIEDIAADVTTMKVSSTEDYKLWRQDFHKRYLAMKCSTRWRPHTV
jgi:hypothetical protein